MNVAKWEIDMGATPNLSTFYLVSMPLSVYSLLIIMGKIPEKDITHNHFFHFFSLYLQLIYVLSILLSTHSKDMVGWDKCTNQ